jgi:hypothetical protein
MEAKTSARTPCALKSENLLAKFEHVHLMEELEAGQQSSPDPSKVPDTAGTIVIGSNDTVVQSTPPSPPKKRKRLEAPVAGGYLLAGLTCFHTVQAYLAAQGFFRVRLRYHMANGREMSLLVCQTTDEMAALDAYGVAKDFAEQCNLERGVVLRMPARPIWF